MFCPVGKGARHEKQMRMEDGDEKRMKDGGRRAIIDESLE